MAYLKLIERNLEKSKPEPLILFFVSNSQYIYSLCNKPIAKLIKHGQASNQTTIAGFFILCKTILSLDPSHLYVKFCSNNAFDYKHYILVFLLVITKLFTNAFKIFVFKKFVIDIANAISKVLEIL